MSLLKKSVFTICIYYSPWELLDSTTLILDVSAQTPMALTPPAQTPSWLFSHPCQSSRILWMLTETTGCCY